MAMEVDFLYLNKLFSLLDAILVDRLNVNPPIPGVPLVESVEPFSGNPIEAVNMALGSREGSRNVLLYGYSQEVAFERTADDQPLSNNIPVNLLLIRSFEGRAGRRADFAALNALHDALYRLMRHDQVSPNDLGVYNYSLLSMTDLATEAGGWGGRRLVYNFLRAGDPVGTELIDTSSLLLDTFTGTLGTSLDAHAPDRDPVGGGWTITEGTADLDGAGSVALGLTTTRAIIDVGASLTGNIALQLTGDTQNGEVGMIFRYLDGNNFWHVKLSPGNGLELFSMNGGLEVLQDDDASGGGYALGETFELTVVTRGSSITVTETLKGNAVAATSTFGEAETVCGIMGTGKAFMLKQLA